MTNTNEVTADARADIKISPEGHGSVTIDGVFYPLSGGSVEESREEAKRRVAAHAQATGHPVPIRVLDPDGEFHLIAAPDGGITVAAENLGNSSPQRVADESTQPVAGPPSGDTASAPEPPEEEDPAWIEEKSRPATEGGRGVLARLGFKVSPGAAEVEARRAVYEQRRAEEQERQEQETRAVARRRRQDEVRREQRAIIQQPFGRPVTLVICNLKGGSVKTTSTANLGATFGTIRGGGVVAWDANEAMGNLGDRSLAAGHEQTVVDLLDVADSKFSTMEGSRLGLLDAFLRPQGDSHFDVLASDDDPAKQLIVGSDEFKKIHEILSRYYRMILVDTGNNIRADHFHAALEAADQLVIPVAVKADSAKVAHRMMDAFEESGHGHLVKNAVAMIHQLKPETEASDEYLALQRTIAADLAPRVATVIPVPYDGHLEGGDRIDYAALAEETRAAYQEAAAAAAEGIARAVREPIDGAGEVLA